ncbi:MAG: hypothetical protein COC01_04025 [Bacteroidetes bacterium]|nr:MAG: hypothetical protein COC01_04025 [Bacteroidota bacterium]
MKKLLPILVLFLFAGTYSLQAQMTTLEEGRILSCYMCNGDKLATIEDINTGERLDIEVDRIYSDADVVQIYYAREKPNNNGKHKGHFKGKGHQINATKNKGHQHHLHAGEGFGHANNHDTVVGWEVLRMQ